MHLLKTLALGLAGFMACHTAAVAQDVVVEKLDLGSGSQAIYPTLRDSVLYFASDKKWDVVGKTFFNQRNQFLYRIYRVKVKDRKPHGAVRPYFSKAGEGTNMFTISFNPDGAAYVTENNMDATGLRGAPMEIKMYASPDDENGHKIDSHEGASSGMCSISEDGRLMVFASDARGGEGRADLYYCTFSLAGWSEPKSLGPVVNTPGTETSPYIHPSGKIFFASDGRDDSQGLDIYYTLMSEDGTFSEPQKLDDGINSTRDDYGLFYSEDEKWGYVTSNRKKGEDAIYYFHRTFPTFENAVEMEPVEMCYELYEASAENYDTTTFQCRWNFGDGESAIGIEVSHCYKELGTYNIELSVLDKTSGEEMFSLAQYELEIARPDQIFISVPEHIKAGKTVTFEADGTPLTDFYPSEFYWTISNGDKIKGTKISTIFPTPGTYRVECGTIDARNKVDTRATWVEVTVE